MANARILQVFQNDKPAIQPLDVNSGEAPAFAT
jgi:hypothetical protein